MIDADASSVTRAERRHLASQEGASRSWWFLSTLAVLRNPIGAPRTPAVIELTVPPSGAMDLDVDTLFRHAAAHDVHIVGPSLEDAEARAWIETH